MAVASSHRTLKSTLGQLSRRSSAYHDGHLLALYRAIHCPFVHIIDPEIVENHTVAPLKLWQGSKEQYDCRSDTPTCRVVGTGNFTFKSNSIIGFLSKNSEDLRRFNSSAFSASARNISNWSPLSSTFSSEATKDDSAGNPTSIANEICIILKGSPWGPDVEKALERFIIQINPNIVVEILRKRCTRASRLYSFFRWLENQPDYKHNSAVYHTMVMVLAEKQKFKAAQHVIEDMHKQGLQVCTASSILIRNYGKRCKVQKSFKVLDDLRTVKGCSPNGEVYNALVGVLMKVKDYPKVLSTFEEMLGAGVKPSALHVDTVLYYYENAESPGDVLTLFKQLIEKGLIPVDTAYSTLIDSCSRTGRLLDAYSLLLEIIQNGVIPDNNTYARLVDAIQKAGESHKVDICDYASLRIIQENAKTVPNAGDDEPSMALKSNSQPVVVDISNILSQSSWGPDKEAALQGLLGDLHPSHVSEVLHNNLIDSKEAFMFFKWLGQQSGFKHTVSTYHAMIGRLSKENQFDSAHELLDTMHNDGLEVMTAMAIIIRACGRSGMVEEAIQAFERLKTLNCGANVQVYNALIGVYLRAGNYEKVLSIYKDMSDLGQIPDISNLRNLLYFYQTAEKPEEVYKVFEELKEKTLIPLAIGYNVFIDGLSKTGKLQEAFRLFEEMLSTNHLDVKSKLLRTYNILKCQIKKMGDLDKAQSYHDMMVEKGFENKFLV